MKSLIAISILALGVISLNAQEANTNAAAIDPLSFEAFKVITQRNIFDPNRSAPGVRREERREERPKRTETFTLLGSISYEKGDFAFFDGSRSEYRKSVKAGESIAGYKIAEVSGNRVTLEADGKKVELPVGSQMKRVEGEEWQVNAHVETTSAPTSESSSTESGNSGESKSASGSGEVSEALKRLMERRRRGD
jgi:hypothetical protein